MNAETKLYLVHNNGEYSGFAVLALFTDRDLAETFANAAKGAVEEWPANVPPEKWTTWSGSLQIKKDNGSWNPTVFAHPHDASIERISVTVKLGHFSGWDEPDPKTGEYTHAYGEAHGQSEGHVRKMLLDTFWKKIAELEGVTPVSS